jgi:hypothetical protein
LIDYPAVKGKTLAQQTAGGKRFRYRSSRRHMVQYDISDLENPIVLHFVNSQDDEGLIQFFSRFGLLMGRDLERDEALDWRKSMRQLLSKAGGGDPLRAVEAVNAALESHKRFGLTPRLDLAGKGNAPRLGLRPQSLLALMLMEVAMVVANGALLAHCDHCDKAFLTGSKTGRRSHAVYCADRCRVAALRARNRLPTTRKELTSGLNAT